MNNEISSEARKDNVVDQALKVAQMTQTEQRRVGYVADRIKSIRTKAADLLPDEPNKGEFIGELDRMIDIVESAATLLHLGPMPAKEFMEEIFAMLVLRTDDLARSENLGTLEHTRDILRERAANIAAAYADRVLREGK